MHIVAIRSRFTLLLFIICALSIPSCNRGPDASTPKKAAIAFTNALEAGDMKTARQVAKGTDSEFDLAKNLGQWMASAKRYHAASVERFGEEGKSYTFMPADLAVELQSANEEIQGDNATIVLTAVGKYPMKLVKDGSEWKVDLQFIDVDAQAVKSIKELGDAAKALDGVSKELEERTMKTIGDAKIALATRVYGEPSNLATPEPADPSAPSVAAAQAQIAALSDAIELYHANTGAYPKALGDLVKQPSGVADWKGPYTPAEGLNDPWNHPYYYRAPGSHNFDRFDLYSAGPDGKAGTGDDITNWTNAVAPG